MTHSDQDRLTLWIHGFLEAGDGAAIERHLSDCGDCRAAAAAIREEARLLSREIARPEQLLALKNRLLEVASGKRVSRGLLWQVPVAAAVLLGLVGVLFSGGPRHSLVEGRATLNDGRVIAAPSDLSASETWQLRSMDQVRMRLVDQSTVNLSPGAEISLAPGGERGVRPELAAGEAEFSVAPDSRRLTIESPAGRVIATDGTCSLRIVFREEGGDAMKKTFAGALVTVLAGSMSLSSAGGVAQADAGQSAVLARTEAPLFLSSPQDKQDDLLRRLEQLAARVAKLEGEVTQLEEKNRQLKLQVAGNAGNGAWGTFAPGQAGGGVRVIQSAPGAAPGSTVIIELKEEQEKKPERRNNPGEK